MASHVGQFFRLAGVHRHVVGASVFANDHSLVDFLLRPDEEATAHLNAVERVGHAGAAFHRNKHAVVAAWNLAFVRAVFLEEVTGDAVTLGEVHEIGFKADDATRRRDGLNQDTVRIVLHIDDLGFAAGEVLQNVTKVLWRDINIEGLHRLKHGAVLGAPENNLGARNEKLEALAAHLLHEHGDLHFATGLHIKVACNIGVCDHDGNIATCLANEAVANLTRGE